LIHASRLPLVSRSAEGHAAIRLENDCVEFVNIRVMMSFPALREDAAAFGGAKTILIASDCGEGADVWLSDFVLLPSDRWYFRFGRDVGGAG
jgi:hypothetical protein